MSQEIDLREDSDDNGEWPNTAAVPPLPYSRKRPRHEDAAQLADHREPHEGIATAGSQPMQSDSKKTKTSRDDVSTNKLSQKLSTSKPPSNASGWQGRLLTPWEQCWEHRLGELTGYHKIHGHCNVPQKYSENTKLGVWVGKQRTQYRLHLEGKKSFMTAFRINALGSLDFEWDSHNATWGDRLGELADYRKIHGHCNVPQKYRENTTLANWVANQRQQYKLHLQGKKSHMTTFRIQQLESLGFEWGGCCNTAWECRLSELADYRKIHGHCNVPHNYSENAKLANWVGRQRCNYRLYVKGKTSEITLPRIEALDSLGFEWGVCLAATWAATWEDRLGELADFRKIYGHCNVPTSYNENTKLAKWVFTQRTDYTRLHVEGKTSSMTLSRIQKLESLGFEWKPSISRKKGNQKKPSLDDDATRAHKKPANSRQGADSGLETAPFNEMFRATGYH
jgi:hypothetical protein